MKDGMIHSNSVHMYIHYVTIPQSLHTPKITTYMHVCTCANIGVHQTDVSPNNDSIFHIALYLLCNLCMGLHSMHKAALMAVLRLFLDTETKSA